MAGIEPANAALQVRCSTNESFIGPRVFVSVFDWPTTRPPYHKTKAARNSYHEPPSSRYYRQRSKARARATGKHKRKRAETPHEKDPSGLLACPRFLTPYGAARYIKMFFLPRPSHQAQ